jgi:hypothetical protein
VKKVGRDFFSFDHINKIVQDLQDYARQLNPKAGEADIKRIIENC